MSVCLGLAAVRCVILSPRSGTKTGPLTLSLSKGSSAVVILSPRSGTETGPLTVSLSKGPSLVSP